MLANGSKLEYESAEGIFTELTGLKEIPELGGDPEKVENTTLADTVKQYEYGVTDYGDLEFKYKYENSSATSPYRVLRGFAAAKTKKTFRLTLKDGTKFEWDAIPNVKLSGGTVNDPIDFTLAMALQSDIVVTDPV